MAQSTTTRQPMIAGRTAAAYVLALWIVYTAIYTSPLSDAGHAILEFVPGLLAVAALWWAGYRNGNWTVRAAPLSRPGLVALVLVLPVLFAPILSGKWVGFDLLATLVFPLASGVTQEIFFRGALLPASIRLCGGRSMRGVVLQAVLFGLWHAPKAYLSAPAGVSPWVGVIALSVVTFLAGLGWGWQVQRDRTIIWATGQHIIFLMIMSLFGM